jgi:hypothetical protein
MELSAWWAAWFGDSLLSKVALALRNIPLSAAATERNWSMRGAIHTKSRNRLKVSTASQITYIKQNSLIQHADLFKLKNRTEASSSSSMESFVGPIAAQNNDIDTSLNIDNSPFDEELSHGFDDY